MSSWSVRISPPVRPLVRASLTMGPFLQVLPYRRAGFHRHLNHSSARRATPLSPGAKRGTASPRPSRIGADLTFLDFDPLLFAGAQAAWADAPEALPCRTWPRP